MVKNEGTVTLGNLTVVDTRARMLCEEPASGLLGQGEEYECRGSIQVRRQLSGQPHIQLLSRKQNGLSLEVRL